MTTREEEIIQYRLERAKDSLQEAKVLAKNKHWNGCVNRLYYACYYCVTSLLVKKGISSTKHYIIKTLFNYHFIKKGKVSDELGSLYHDLYQTRMESDFKDFVNLEQDKVKPWVDQVNDFIKSMEKLLAEKV